MAPVTRPLPSPVHSVAEFVDDSEPEREEERKLWKEKKRHPKVTNRTPLHAEAAGSSRVAPFPSVKVVTPGFTSVIELSDSSTEENDQPLVALSRASNAVSVPSVPSDLPSDEPFSPVRPMTLGIDIPDDEIDDDGSNLRLKLSRFAYSQESLKDRSGRSTPQSLRPSPAPAVASGSDLLPQPKGRRGRPLNPVMFFDLPESQASRLRKCVSCGIAWTTRKSAKNKVSHIRTCARKKGLNQDTLSTLIAQELASLPADNEKSKGKTPRSPPKDQVPHTYLEDVVNGANSKSKGRRPEAVATVQGPVDARESILDRARSLLGNPGCEASSSRTQAFGQSKLANSLTRNVTMEEFPETQPFGESALSKRLALLRSHTGSTVESEDYTAPPATQAFVPSKLGAGLRRPQENTEPTRQQQHTSVISIPSSPSNSCHSPHLYPSSANANSPSRPSKTSLDMRRPSRHPSPVRRPSEHQVSPWTCEAMDVEDGGESRIEGYGDEMGWSNEDVFLHFEPDWEPTPNQPVSSAITPSSVAIQMDKDIGIPAAENAATSSTKSSRKGKGKAKARADDTAGRLDDPALDAELKKKILADEGLYLRILRYEPIAFDTFMNIAATLNVSERGLRLKVRSFLDNEVRTSYLFWIATINHFNPQGINFFGAEPGGSRTRKRP